MFKLLSPPHSHFLNFVVLYVVVISVSAVTGGGVAKLFAYMIAFAMLFYMLLYLSGMPDYNSNFPKSGITLPYFLYYYGLFGSLIFNIDHLDWANSLKFIMAPLFLYIGLRVEQSRPFTRSSSSSVNIYFAILILLPLLVLLYQIFKGYDVMARGADYSVFANRNNAALYVLILIALYAVYSLKPITNLFVYIIAGAGFGTLGVLLSVIFSLVAIVANKKNFYRFVVFTIFSTCVILVLSHYNIGIFARFRPVIGTIEIILDPTVSIVSMSYERLYYALHTTDLSFAFRIKHWGEILDLYYNGSVFDKFWGFGVGSSIKLTEAHLVPHNDYLRYLFEMGFITFLGYIMIIVRVVVLLGKSWECVPFFAVALYMFSENLVDNYLAMVVFYYSAGVLIRRKLTSDYSK